jgi:hypothetical protein
VGVDLGAPHFDRDLVELGLLAETAGMQPVARLTCKRAPDAALFVGSGKADEIRCWPPPKARRRCCSTRRSRPRSSATWSAPSACRSTTARC